MSSYVTGIKYNWFEILYNIVGIGEKINTDSIDFTTVKLGAVGLYVYI